jgi:hypothetical protein
MPRRQFISKAVRTFGLVLGSGMLGSELWRPRLVQAASSAGSAPQPIPGGFTYPGLTELFHANEVACGVDESSITDFKGSVGAAHLQGNATSTNTNTGKTSTLFYDADMRYMQGHYIGVDGNLYKGTFCFL